MNSHPRLFPPAFASFPPSSGLNPPAAFLATRPRPRLGLGLGLRKFPAKGRQLAALLNLGLNLNKKAPAPSSQPHAYFNFNFNFNLKPRIRAPRGRAFTLIELMVAAAITTLLLLGMTGIFDQSMKAWRLSSRRADAEREVRSVLTMVQRDFAGVVVQTNLPIIWMTNAALANLVGPSLPPAYDQGGAVFFLTTSAAGQSGRTNGDLAGVGYYVAWSTNYRPEGSYDLYRYYLTGTNLLAAITNYLAKSNSFFPVNPSGDELVGANVANFLTEFKTLPSGFGLVSNNSPGLLTNRPGYVQLELTAYGSEAVRSLSTSNDWVSTNTIQKFGRTFLWRVDL